MGDEKKREETTKKRGNGVELQQTTLEFLVERFKSYCTDHPRAKVITSHVAEMMATDIQPFSIVSDVGFKQNLSLDMFCQVNNISQKFLYHICMQKSSKEFQSF